MHDVAEVFPGEGEVAPVEGEGAAIDVDRAVVNRLPCRVAQVGNGIALGLVLPVTQRVGSTQRGRDVVSQLDFEVVLIRVVLGAGAEDVPRQVGVVAFQHRTVYRRTGIARCAG